MSRYCAWQMWRGPERLRSCRAGVLGLICDKNLTARQNHISWREFPFAELFPLQAIHSNRFPPKHPPSIVDIVRAMATKSGKAGEKRKAFSGSDKPAKRFPDKKEGPQSARKLWKNEDASDDSSDDDSNIDNENADAAPPAKKKVKHINQESDQSNAKPAKTFEKGMLRTSNV